MLSSLVNVAMHVAPTMVSVAFFICCWPLSCNWVFILFCVKFQYSFTGECGCIFIISSLLHIGCSAQKELDLGLDIRVLKFVLVYKFVQYA